MELISMLIFAGLTMLVSTVLGFLISYFGSYIPLLGGLPAWVVVILIFLSLMLINEYGVPLQGLYAWIFEQLGETIT